MTYDSTVVKYIIPQFWQRVEAQNKGPWGRPLIPVVESECLPEGVIVVKNLEAEPRTCPHFQWIDLR